MAPAASLEDFIVAVRQAVEEEARAHADDRWWVLSPTLLVQRADGHLGFLEIGPRLAGRPVGRALLAADPRLILDALGVRRCAIALHVDIGHDGELFAAIVLMVLSAVTLSLASARVERSERGTPSLGMWEPGFVEEQDVFAAVSRALRAEPV